MEGHSAETVPAQRVSNTDEVISSLSFGIFNHRSFSQDIKFYPNDSLSASGAHAADLAETRSRSWSVADTKTIFSTDSDNSDCSREISNRLSVASQGEYHNFECARSLSDECESRGPSPFSLPEQNDNRWAQPSPTTPGLFTAGNSEKIHFSTLPHIDNLDLVLSADNATTNLSCPLTYPPTKCDKFVDAFGFAAGIAQISRKRGGSLGEPNRQVYSIPQPLSSRAPISYQRSEITNDMGNDVHFESALPTHRTTLPPYGSSLTDLEQPGFCSPTGFSPPRGPYANNTTWMESKDQDRFPSVQHAAPREMGSLRLQDILPDHRPSSRASLASDSTMTSPRDYNNDSLFSQYASNSRSVSPHPECNSPISYGLRKFVNPMDMPPPIGAKNICHQQSSPDEYSIIQRQHQSEIFPPMTDLMQQLNDGNVYQVQFKRCYRCFKLPMNSQLHVRLGEFVIVEADRGEDLGVVTAIAPFDSPHAASIYASSGLSMRMTNDDFSKKILRIATMEERVDLQFKKQQEVILLEVCRDRARDIHALPISLVDAEYQFDRNKLVIYYVASRRLDFREFVRDLFAVYKTRIWMEQAVPDSNFAPSETVALALQTGHLHMNPLITPAPAPRVRSGAESPVVDYSHSGNYSPRLPERRNNNLSSQSPNGYLSRQGSQRDQNGRVGYSDALLYEQNLKLQEMRLAQHPQRQSNRYYMDQKCKELQLQKERELNEEIERGVDSFNSLNMYSAILPY